MNERLRQVRKALKLTQAEMASEMNVTNNYIYLLEKGKSPITEKFIFVLCNTYEVNREWFVSGIGEMFVVKSIDDQIAALTTELFMKEDIDDETKENVVSILNTALQMSPEQLELFLKIARSLKGE